MMNKNISKKLSELNVKTSKRRSLMKSIKQNEDAIRTINQNFKDLERIVYSAIK